MIARCLLDRVNGVLVTVTLREANLTIRILLIISDCFIVCLLGISISQVYSCFSRLRSCRIFHKDVSKRFIKIMDVVKHCQSYFGFSLLGVL